MASSSEPRRLWRNRNRGVRGTISPQIPSRKREQPPCLRFAFARRRANAKRKHGGCSRFRDGIWGEIVSLTPRLRFCQSLLGSLEEAIIAIVGALQIEHARRRIAGSPGGREMVVIFESGRAELVIVRIPALGEDQTPGGGHQFRYFRRVSL